MNIETEIAPPEPINDEEGDDTSIRVSAHLIGRDDVAYDAATQLFNPDAQGPDELADALLNVMLGLAQLHSSDLSWAMQQRLTRYGEQS